MPQRKKEPGVHFYEYEDLEITPTSFTNPPSDLILMIADLLDDCETVSAYMMTSRRFYQVVSAKLLTILMKMTRPIMMFDVLSLQWIKSDLGTQSRPTISFGARLENGGFKHGEFIFYDGIHPLWGDDHARFISLWTRLQQYIQSHFRRSALGSLMIGMNPMDYPLIEETRLFLTQHGRLSSKSRFVGGLLEGKVENYDYAKKAQSAPTAFQKTIKHYSHDLLEGEMIRYYHDLISETITKTATGYYHKDRKEGEFEKFDQKTGIKSSSKWYFKGKKNGEEQRWAVDTGVKTKSVTFINDIKEGHKKRWDHATAMPTYSVLFTKGKMKKEEQKWDHLSGRKTYSCWYSKGQPDGELQEWNDSATKTRSIYFKRGRREGTEQEWDEHSILVYSCQYKNGRRFGSEKHFDEQGNITSQARHQLKSSRQ